MNTDSLWMAVLTRAYPRAEPRTRKTVMNLDKTYWQSG